MTEGKNLRKPLEGVFPLVPFSINEDQSPDYDGLASNIEFLAQSGVQGTVMFGCMGEFYAPSNEEFDKCVEVGVQAAAGRIAVVVGATWQNTHECIRRAKVCEKAGADGVMIAAPYTISPTKEVVLNHFREINKAVDEIQIMFYNYPPLARGFNASPEFWDYLLEFEHITALKESNGDTWHRTMICDKLSGKINIFPGGEPWMFSDLLMGAKGVVSLFGIAIPKVVLAYFNYLKAKDLDKSLPLARKFTELSSYITLENEVAALKATAEIGGQKAGNPRIPYTPLEPELFAKFSDLLNELSQMI